MKRLKKNKYLVGFLVILLVLLVIVLIRNNDNDNVETDRIVITQEELDTHTSSVSQFYQANSQNYQLETINKDTYDQVVRKRLIEDYATKNGITIDQEAVNDLYKLRVDNQGGEDKLLSVVESDWGLNKQEYLDSLYYDLLRDKVQESLDISLAGWVSQRLEEVEIKIE